MITTKYMTVQSNPHKKDEILDGLEEILLSNVKDVLTAALSKKATEEEARNCLNNVAQHIVLKNLKK